MTKRWLSLVVVLTLLVSCFAGAAAEEVTPKGTTLPEISFKPAAEEIIFATDETKTNVVLGHFTLDAKGTGKTLKEAVTYLKNNVLLMSGTSVALGADNERQWKDVTLSDDGVLKATIEASTFETVTGKALVFYTQGSTVDNSETSETAPFYCNFLPNSSAVAAYRATTISTLYISDAIKSVEIGPGSSLSPVEGVQLIGADYGKFGLKTVVIDGYKRPDVITLNAQSKGAKSTGETFVIDDDDGSDDVTYTWASSNEDVVTIDKDTGKLSAVGKGTTTVTVTAKNKATSAGMTQSITVTVNDKEPSTSDLSIEAIPASMLSGTTIKNLPQNQSVQLVAKFKEGITDTGVTWESSNAKVATVDQNGLVTAVASTGSATITATSTANTSVTASVTVKVKAAASALDKLTILLTDNKGEAKALTESTLGYAVADAKLSFFIPNDNTTIKYYVSETDPSWSVSSGSDAKAVYEKSGMITYTSPIDMNKSGTYYVYVAANRGTEYKAAKTTVTVAINVTKVTVTATPAELAGGGTVELKAALTPANAKETVKDVKWSVPVANVDTAAMTKAGIKYNISSSNVTGTGETFTIIVKGDQTSDVTFDATASVKNYSATNCSEDGTVNGKAAIKVTKVSLQSVALSPTPLEVAVGSKIAVTTTLTPANAPATLTYDVKNISSSDQTKYASYADGYLTGVTKGSGKAKLVVTATLGSTVKTFEAAINVVDELQTIAAPEFVTASGTTFDKHESKVKVTCSTVDVTMYYTLDGTDPIANADHKIYTKDGITLPDNEKTTVKIYATKAGKNSAVSTAEYTVDIPVTGVEFENRTKMTFQGKAAAQTKKATVSPSETSDDYNAKDQSVTFTSSAPSVVKVEEVGYDATKPYEHTVKVTPLKVGSAVVTVTTANNKTDSFAVEVTDIESDITSFDISGDTSVAVNEWVDLKAVFKNRSGVDKTSTLLNNGVTWTLTNPEGKTVAEIVQSSSNTIRIKGVATGVATLRAVSDMQNATKNGPKYDKTVTLTVNAESTTVKAPVITVKYADGDKVTAAGSTYTIEETAYVTVESATMGTKLYYTLNGATPNNTSTEVPADGLKIAEDCILSVIAYKDSKASTVTTAIFETNFTVEKVTLDQTSATVVKGKTLQLNAALTPPDASATFIWESANKDIATVNGSGVVTAKGIGTTKIKVKVQDSTLEATCTVTVVGVEAESLTITPSTAELDVGSTMSLTALLEPANADATINWTSDKPAVVAVNTATGNSTTIEAKAAGTATITASYGGKTATCTVTVSDSAQTEPTKLPTLTMAASSFTLDSNSALSQVVGQFTAGSGETMRQILAYYNIQFTTNTTFTDGTAPSTSYAVLNVDSTGALTATFPNTGTKDSTTTFTWKLVWKTTSSGTGTLNGSGSTNSFKVNILQKPTAINFTAATVADTSLEGGKTATLDFGTIANYADFTATGVAVTATANVSGTGITATAAIDSNGKVTATVEGLVKGEYTVTVTLSASGCTSVTTGAAKVTVTSDKPAPVPVKKAIVVTKGTAYEGIKGVTQLAKADNYVTFDVTGLAEGVTVTSWKSSKPAYVAIDEHGIATLKKAGKAKITATMSDNSKLSIDVNVNKGSFADPADITLQTKPNNKWVDVTAEGITVVPKKSGQKSVPSRLNASDDGKIVIQDVEFSNGTIASRDGDNPSPIKVKKRSISDGETTTLTITANGAKFSVVIKVDSGAKDVYLEDVIAEIEEIIELEAE